MFTRILLPVDGSEASRVALATAVQLARHGEARLRIVHLFDALDHLTGFEHDVRAWNAARADASALVDDAVATARAAGVAADGVLLEAPGRGLGEVVADEARACGADLVVVGTLGRRGVSRALLGSGAEQVLRLAPVPVLAVRPPPFPAPA